MRFNVAQLIKAPTGESRHYDLVERVSHLDPELASVRPLEGSVTLMRTSQGILVTGTLRTRLRAECRRCLEPYDEDIDLDLEEEFLPVLRIELAPIDDVPESERDDALLIDSDHILDLSEVIRQELLIAQTEEGLCRSDCAGLCPNCGGNRNLGECDCDQTPIDPRWADLQALLSDEPD